MKYWFRVKGSGFNGSFSIDIHVSINALSAKRIAIQGRTKCPWKNNKVGSGLRTGTEMILVFTWKTHLSVLEWTCICLHLFLQASYYLPTSNSEWMSLWGAVSALSLNDLRIKRVWLTSPKMIFCLPGLWIWSGIRKLSTVFSGPVWNVHKKMPDTPKAQVAAFLVDLASCGLVVN